MPSLKDLRNRIGSVKATRKIARAMQMVAAAKLRHAQKAATAARPYAERITRVLSTLNKHNQQGGRLTAAGRHQDGSNPPAHRHDGGLCGGFNSNIVRLARADAQRRCDPTGTGVSLQNLPSR
jgi:F-type H+-transporting ATPase subunit gamma